ncbi:7-cyano-7-deazaguanine synthase [bacterium]|nr:7-cyano-7-deazaguanine synthase [bacterium]
MNPSRSGSVVTLVSGGLDSLLFMADALAAGESILPVHVRQGALWEDAEAYALRNILIQFREKYGARAGSLIETRIEFPHDYPSRWAVDPSVAPPGADSSDDSVYLPGRNLALLLAGSLVAHAHGIPIIRIGTLDTNPFRDSADDFLRRFEDLFAAATGFNLKIEKPLAGRAKGQWMRSMADLPYILTVSCLRPEGLRHCGHCNKCAERRRAFADAGLADPTNYF